MGEGEFVSYGIEEVGFCCFCNCLDFFNKLMDLLWSVVWDLLCSWMCLCICWGDVGFGEFEIVLGCFGWRNGFVVLVCDFVKVLGELVNDLVVSFEMDVGC